MQVDDFVKEMEQADAVGKRALIQEALNANQKKLDIPRVEQLWSVYTFNRGTMSEKEAFFHTVR